MRFLGIVNEADVAIKEIAFVSKDVLLVIALQELKAFIRQD
jgi:hypothetical protein